MKENRGKLIRHFLIAAMVLVFAFAGSTFAATTATRTMTRSKNGSAYLYADKVGKVGSQTYFYHKVVVPTSGILAVTGYAQTSNSLRLVLCNSSKKAIDVYTGNTVNYKSSTYSYYGVRAGTYYIRVDAKRAGKGRYYYVYAKLTPMKNDTWSASSTISMTRGKQYYDVLPAGTAANGASYFRFYANGTYPAKVKIITAAGQGRFEAFIKGPSWPGGTTKALQSSATNTLTLSRKNYSTGRVIGPKPGWYTVIIRKRQAHSSSVDYRKSNGGFKISWSY